ncbi:MAG: Histone deacetylase hda1, partial [Pleopsidium flavum]
MDHDDEDVLMTDLAARPTSVSASFTWSGLERQARENESMNGHVGPGLASTLLNRQAAQSLASGSTGQKLRSASVLANDVAGNLNISSSKSEEESDDELNDDASEGKPDFSSDPLRYSKLPTGLCYDVRMRYHCELEPSPDEDGYVFGADPDLHPEDPRRIWSIYHELCHAGLVEDKMSIYGVVKNPLARIAARDASPAEICLIHTGTHYDFVKSLKNMSRHELQRYATEGDSIYYNKLTFLSAVLSAGGAIETCRAVAGRLVKNAIAVIRPPGHHAEADRAMGFCLFNNVCIAARVCQEDFGEDCRKILIVDWDVHHGNGVQKAFYDDPNVLYISIHVHMDGRFYPSGPNGDHLHCGKGAGIGRNVNIPWPSQGMGDADYMLALQNIVMPIANEFDPDLVIISAGFDAAAGDTLGGCFVTPACYGHMTHMLMSLADGKVVVCLEGGYNLKSISKSALAVTRTLMGEPPDRLASTAATKPGVATVQKVRLQQSKYWRCLYPKDNDQDIQNALGAERMHDIIRAYQSKHLYDNYKMVNLYIFRERISQSFENQVLATSDYHKAQPLIVIFHDP